MYAHSVEKRFILIVCAALLLLVAPLFALFFFLSYDRAVTEDSKNIDLMMVANAQALGKPLWDFDVESVRKIADTVVSNSRVVRVDVKDTVGEIHIVTPSELEDAGKPLQEISSPIRFSSVDGDKEVGTLTVWVERTTFHTVIDTRDIVFLSIFRPRRPVDFRCRADCQPDHRYPAAVASDRRHRCDTQAWFTPAGGLDVQ